MTRWKKWNSISEGHDFINTAIFCEGKNDVFFLHEIVTSTLNIQTNHVCHYEKISRFQRDLANNRHKKISISGDNGYELPETVCNVVEDFWYHDGQDLALVVGDTDRGSVYTKIFTPLKNSIDNRRPKPYVNPILTPHEKENKLTIRLRNGRIITILIAEVPDSLEIQLLHYLRATYRWVPRALNEDDALKFACNKLHCTMEELIRRSVPHFVEQQWFKQLCNRIQQTIPSDIQRIRV